MSFRHDSEEANSSSGFFNTHRSFAVKDTHCYSSKTKKDLNLLADSNFLSNFSPENSKRDQAKMKRQTYTKTSAKPKSSFDRTSMYDEFGLVRQTQDDLCDCFESTCAGCNFPCTSCGSQKCAIKCRVNRKISHEVVEDDGKNPQLKSPLFSFFSYRNS
ncbi:unnamed protein product [Diamesa serratosioi]